MLELGPVLAPAADLLRLLAVPGFLLAAYTDVRSRRVPNRVWPPVVAVAVVALALEGWSAFAAGGFIWRQFALVTGLSLVILVPLAFGLWYFGGFGGADAKAIMALAVLFPGLPTYVVLDAIYPPVVPATGVFSLAILLNAALLGLAYPLALLGRNVVAGDVAPVMVLGRPVAPTAAAERPGRLLEGPSGFDLRGLDLDALRMYLAWRGCTLEELRADPARVRDTPPEATGEPGDGAVADGGEAADPWAAEAFLADAGHAYGTTPEALRDGLTVLADRERVWYSPGMPFVAIIALGLLVALVYGDLFTGLVDVLGSL